ncbi:MAG: NADH ubiquinone oxidoreductase [Roseovarius sp.]|nr:NADH ubiquinone oxidoreductase [Roseovarius sp.]MBK44477.1 NADH ubiquinone oxidoreductase [Roseovarius sp.]|tara:strand:- start:263 stop:808 length:546 start_codon:yes stop_codon:yes gene_type:complete
MRVILPLLLSLAMSGPARPDPVPLDYDPPPLSAWSYVSDQVMGGVSEGGAAVDGDHLRLSGEVSTANRGGFIQTRVRLARRFPAGAAGLVIRVRGNGERYFVHLRTTGTVLPWQYYQAGFEAGTDWQVLRLPFTAFRPSGALLRAAPRPGTVTSVGFVAFGRDHRADLEAVWLGLYAEPDR